MLNKSFIEGILDYCVCHGADFAEVFYEDVTRCNLTLINERISNCTLGQDSGIGIRYFKGGASHYIHTGEVSEAGVMNLLRKELRQRNGSYGRYKLGEEEKLYLDYIKKNPTQVQMDEKLNLLKRVVVSGKNTDSVIKRVRANYLDMDQKVQIANTEGIFLEDERIKTRVIMTMFAEAEGESQSSYVGPGAMKGFEFYEEIDLDEYAKNTALNAKAMLKARSCPSGRMPVVIANGFGGLFFHEACGHTLEAPLIAKGCSEFSYELGEKVASDKVTLIDDGSIKGQWGSLRVDDEGTPTKKNILIENGVLKGFLVDKFNGRKLGMMPTGSARRESYRYAPTARMTNTYIAPGQDKLDHMIKSIDKGLFVKSINAGSVNSITGEFNFNTSETYLIEKGEILAPVRGATLIGTGSDILKKVDMVGDDYALGQGFCYAGSGALYIGAGQPSVRVKEITVGGRER